MDCYLEHLSRLLPAHLCRFQVRSCLFRDKLNAFSRITFNQQMLNHKQKYRHVKKVINFPSLYTFVSKLRDRLFLCKVRFKENLGHTVIKLFYLIFVTHFSILNSEFSNFVLQQVFYKNRTFRYLAYS